MNNIQWSPLGQQMRQGKKHFKFPRARGFTLVELMVGVLIAMLTMLLVTEVYSNAIWRKRDVAGSSDAQQTASMMMLQISNSLKQAGSATSLSQEAWGCKLQATKNGTTLLPIQGTLAAPFGSLPATLRLAPVIVKAGAVGETSRQSDIILALSAGMESSGLAFVVQSIPNSGQITFPNTNGLVAGDLLMTTNSVSGLCNITQIASGHVTTYTSGKLDQTPSLVAVGGPYAMSTALNDLHIESNVYGLGREPQFNVLGVDFATQSLKVYDLLQMHDLTGPISIAENVFLLKVIYGVDTNNDSIVDSWVSPADAGWTFDELQADSTPARDKLRQIKAVRIALVTRSSYPAATSSFQDEFKLFASVSPSSLHQTIKLTTGEQRYRYQVYESVIPLFNVRTI